ncbi:MAG: hypothetical protein CSB34_03305 [Desulfobulbus propionicus]|nr:MAG: hypothetical protein CSB34_03305 [Desulfobulbus propionicus]
MTSSLQHSLFSMPRNGGVGVMMVQVSPGTPLLLTCVARPLPGPPQQRSHCVEMGLQRWQCRVRRQGGYRFILSIALQGGLPMRLVAEGRGRLGKLLKRILHLCSDISGESCQGSVELREQDIFGWVESLERMLPKSFRQPVIYHLLTEIIVTVLRLKTAAELTSSEDALIKLETQVPNWRDQFPLPLEDAHAQGLIAQLLRDAAEVVVTTASGSPFIVGRSLESGEQGWRLVSSLMLQESIDAAHLAGFFAVDVDMLPRQINLSLSAGEKTHTARLRRIAGKNRFRLLHHFPDILGVSASRDHMMHIDLADGSNWCGLAHHGEELDKELPWVFSAYNDHPFIKQGGGKIAETEAQLALPADWQVGVMDEDSSCQQVGILRDVERTVWQIRGKVTACSEQGETFRFQTGRADATQTSYYWKGEPFWLDFRSPGRAFRGLPELFAVSAEGTTKKVNGKPEFSVLGSKGLESPLGPVMGQYRKGKEIQSRTRMDLSPQEASVEIQGNDAVSGTISLHHWGCSLAKTLTPGLRLDTEKADHSLILQTSLDADVRTPAKLDLEVFWPHSTTPVRLSLPYPATVEEVSETQAIRYAWRCDHCGASGSSVTYNGVCDDCGALIKRQNTCEFLEPAGFAVDFYSVPHNNISTPQFVPVELPWVNGRGKWQPLANPALGHFRTTSQGHLFYHSKGINGTGYALCLACGRAEPMTGGGELPQVFQNPHRKLRRAKEEDGFCTAGEWSIKEGISLGHELHTDIIEFQLKNSDGIWLNDPIAARTIAVALRDSLAELLGVQAIELGCETKQGQPEPGVICQSILIFDNHAAGYASRADNWLSQLFSKAYQKLCCPAKCDSVCPQCVLDFDQRFVADYLDRHTALRWLNTKWLDELQLPEEWQLFGAASRPEHKNIQEAVLYAVNKNSSSGVRCHTGGGN